MKKTRLAIIGSGPAGYTAALYAARANLNPILFEGFYAGPAGGQLMTTTEVENFPGFPKGVTGPELIENFRSQAERFGTQYIAEDVTSIDLSSRPFTITSSQGKYSADSLIIATGATAKRLDIEGAREGEFWQKGVTACAICDGAMPIFRNKNLFVIGGGDSACEEALFLTKYGNKVYLVHRRNELRASKIMAERTLNHPKIEVIWNHCLVKVEGEKVVTNITLENVDTKLQTNHVAAGVFFAVGHQPNTNFLNGQLALDKTGYIKVTPGTTRTAIPGVYAAGDVQDAIYRQAITAAGSGCMAAIDCERWLAEQGLE